MTNDIVKWMDTRHHQKGNVAFTDGSVDQMDDKLLAIRLIETEMATNRLVIP